ncbi:MAG: hypothetical protein ACOYM8_07305 [Caulobacterales bacterium]
MTVFVVHAPGDAALAEKIARVFERDGAFVETEDGARAGPALKGRDMVALVWTAAAAADPASDALTTRALDGWALDRLVIALVDGAAAPAALADLPALTTAAAQAPAVVAEAVATRIAALAPIAETAAIPTPRVEPRAKPAPFAALAALAFAVACALAAAQLALSAGLIAVGGLPFAGWALAAAAVAAVIGLVLGVAALATRRPKIAGPAPDRTLAMAGEAARCAELARALAERGLGAVPVAQVRARMGEADGLVIVTGPGGDGRLDAPTLRALHLADRAGKPIAVLRVGGPDTGGAKPAKLAAAPNAAWPGEARAAAALALALIDDAQGEAP